MAVYKGWRYVVFIGGIVGTIGIAIYPIILEPMMNTEKYKDIQKHTRKNIRQEDVQPGNMNIWSDPFNRKKN